VIGDIPTATSAVLVVNSLSAGLLAVAGVAKIVRPEPAARALYAAGIPGRGGAARAVGFVEVGVGVGAFAIPNAATELVLSLSYLSLAGFVAFLLLARPGSTSCGCAGARDLPPSAAHVALNLAAAGAALVAAFSPPPGPASVVTSLGWVVIPFAIGLAATGTLVVALATETAAAFRAFRAPSGHPIERDAARHARADAALAAAGIRPGHPSLWPEAMPEGTDA
jgi:hypothetical protein